MFYVQAGNANLQPPSICDVKLSVYMFRECMNSGTGALKDILVSP